jgi:hypothetical protein
MKFLKGLALAILGFLLFLSLSVFGLALTLNQTILNPDFVASEVNKLDIPSLAGEFLSEQIPPEGQEFIGEVLDDTIADLEPWIKEQVSTVIYSGYDYLEGRSESLSLAISLEPVKGSLRDNLWEAMLQSLPPELAGLPPAEIERYFNEFYGEIDEQIPSTFELDEALLGADVLAQFEQVRQGISYFHIAFNALIGLILLLIGLIILIHRQVRGSTRGIGITFLICGAVSYAGAFVAKNMAGTQLTQLDMPAYLQTWMPQLVTDTLAPLEMYSIGLAAAGVVLLIVSFVYKRHEAEF